MLAQRDNAGKDFRDKDKPQRGDTGFPSSTNVLIQEGFRMGKGYRMKNLER